MEITKTKKGTITKYGTEILKVNDSFYIHLHEWKTIDMNLKKKIAVLIIKFILN